ncbi:MAG: type I restriction enzyme HsdR N-terminal domain-containing protein [Rubricoccaceae bacterium]|nr:type I restriction enzyme HsdR N-terminal domain-containing protein [Rubricoccaceae bacterium]
MEPLAFPPYALTTRTDAQGRPLVLDPVRRKWVRLTPEERVRQHLLRFLAEQGYPPALTAVEKGVDYLGAVWRADVLVHDRAGQPLLLAECKAPDVPVTQATFDQLARYNAVVRARALLATNGRVHYCCVWSQAPGAEEGAWAFRDAIPPYDTLVPSA